MLRQVYNDFTNVGVTLEALGIKTGKIVPEGIYSEQFGAPGTNTGGGKVSSQVQLPTSTKLRPYIQLWDSGLRTLPTSLSFTTTPTNISINKAFTQTRQLSVNWAGRTASFHTRLFKCSLNLATLDTSTLQARSYTLADGAYITFSMFQNNTNNANKTVLQLPPPATIDGSTTLDFYLMAMPGYTQGTSVSVTITAYFPVNQIVTSTEVVQWTLLLQEIPWIKADGQSVTPVGSNVPGSYPYATIAEDPLAEYFLIKIFTITHSYVERPGAKISNGSWKNAISWAADDRICFDSSLKQYWNEAVVHEMVKAATDDNDGVELQRVITKTEPALAYDLTKGGKYYGDDSANELYGYHRAGGFYASTSVPNSVTTAYALESGFKLSYNPTTPNSGTTEIFLEGGLEIVISCVDSGGSGNFYVGGAQQAFYRQTITGAQMNYNTDPNESTGRYMDYYVGGFGFSTDEVYIHEVRPVILGSENHHNDPAGYLTAWRTAIKNALILPDGSTQNDMFTDKSVLDNAFPRIGFQVDFQDFLQPSQNIMTSNYWTPAGSPTEGGLYDILEVVHSHGDVDVINQTNGQLQQGFQAVKDTVETVLDKVPQTVKDAITKKAVDTGTQFIANWLGGGGGPPPVPPGKKRYMAPMTKYIVGPDNATYYDPNANDGFGETYTLQNFGVTGRIAAATGTSTFIKFDEGPRRKFKGLYGIENAGMVEEQNRMFGFHVVEDKMNQYRTTDTNNQKTWLIPNEVTNAVPTYDVVQDPFLQMFKLNPITS